MSILQRCSSISNLVMYSSTLPSSSNSAPCILLTLTQLKRVCRNFAFRHTLIELLGVKRIACAEQIFILCICFYLLCEGVILARFVQVLPFLRHSSYFHEVAKESHSKVAHHIARRDYHRCRCRGTLCRGLVHTQPKCLSALAIFRVS